VRPRAPALLLMAPTARVALLSRAGHLGHSAVEICCVSLG
jgi:hypothetical protein